MQEAQDRTHQEKEDVIIVELRTIGKRSALTKSNPNSNPVPRFCDSCMVTHLPIHCPKNPHNIPQPIQEPEKANLNMVGVIPLGTKDETVVPLQMISRARAKDLPEPIIEENIEIVPTKKHK